MEVQNTKALEDNFKKICIFFRIKKIPKVFAEFATVLIEYNQ